eukprot:399907_1
MGNVLFVFRDSFGVLLLDSNRASNFRSCRLRVRSGLDDHPDDLQIPPAAQHRLAVAASKALPALGALNITPLVIPPANNFPPPHPKMKFRIRGSYIEELSDFLGKKVGGRVKKVNSFVEGPVEKYGTAFFLSQKVTNLATLLGCAWMVKYGVDLEGFLVNYGMLKEIGDSFGRMACSFMINFALTPAHLTGALVLAPFTEKIRVHLYGNARIKRERFTKMYYEENR